MDLTGLIVDLGRHHRQVGGIGGERDAFEEALARDPVRVSLLSRCHGERGRARYTGNPAAIIAPPTVHRSRPDNETRITNRDVPFSNSLDDRPQPWGAVDRVRLRSLPVSRGRLVGAHGPVLGTTAMPGCIPEDHRRVPVDLLVFQASARPRISLHDQPRST